MAAPLHRDPVADQRTGMDARDRRAGCAQMAQPAEAQQGFGPFARRWIDFERRAAVCDDDLACKRKFSRVDFACDGGVAGAQILRCDEQAFRNLQSDLPAKARVVDETRDESPPAMVGDEHRKPYAFRQSFAAHRICLPFRSIAPTYPSATGCPLSRRRRSGKPLQPCGIEAVATGKPRFLIRKMMGKRT